MRVLISDKINETAFSLFKDNKIDFAYLPEITPEELREQIPQYEALIVRSRTKAKREVILAGKNLKVIGRVGSGVDNIDTLATREKKIAVVNSPDANSQAVAEHAVGLMLALLRKYSLAFSSMKEGLWLKKELSGQELSGKNIGIVGHGHIGKKIEKIVSAFGAKALIFSRSFQTVTLPGLFKNSDLITLHLALTPQTRGQIKGDLLGLMKPSAYLVNTSRGEIIEEKALLMLLTQKKIAGAALDVFWQEPLPAESAWRKLENVILTPHIAASTKEALKKGSLVVIDDIINILRGGKPKNPVL